MPKFITLVERLWVGALLETIWHTIEDLGARTKSGPIELATRAIHSTISVPTLKSLSTLQHQREAERLMPRQNMTSKRSVMVQVRSQSPFQITPMPWLRGCRKASPRLEYIPSAVLPAEHWTDPHMLSKTLMPRFKRASHRRQHISNPHSPRQDSWSFNPH
jgi:hypothetical protein